MTQIAHVRSFNGTSDEIQLDATTYLSLALSATTIAAIVRRDTDTGWRWFWALHRTSGGGAGDGELLYGQDGAVNESLTGYFDSGTAAGSPQSSSGFWNVAMDWCLVAVTKPDGIVTTRNHRYRYDTQEWAHENASSGQDVASPVAGQLWISSYNGATEWWSGEIACIGFWHSTELSDGQLEGLTDDIASWEALSPTGLWLLNQTDTAESVVDLIGSADQVAINGTSVVAESGLAFDVGGASAQPSDDPPIGFLGRGAGW